MVAELTKVLLDHRRPTEAAQRAYRPVIILGAARSGTNMLRDALSALPGVATWNCDEINPIWRHHNVHEPTDEFGVEHASPGAVRYIRRQFDRVAKKSGAKLVLEKTCANSLRIPFVNRVLPNALFVYLVRDGRDAAASARPRWRAPFDLSYTLKKLRYVPKSDLLTLSVSAAANRLEKIASSDDRVGSWGPRFTGIDELVRERSLLEVCALQWRACVDAADDALADIAPHRIFALRYEDFVCDPSEQFQRLTHFLGIETASTSALQSVTGASVGRWRSVLSPDEATSITALLKDSLVRHGYDVRNDTATHQFGETL